LGFILVFRCVFGFSPFREVRQLHIEAILRLTITVTTGSPIPLAQRRIVAANNVFLAGLSFYKDALPNQDSFANY